MLKYTLVKGKRKSFLRKVLGASATGDKLYDLANISRRMDGITGLKRVMTEPLQGSNMSSWFADSADAVQERRIFPTAKPFNLYPQGQLNRGFTDRELGRVDDTLDEMTNKNLRERLFNEKSPKSRINRLTRLKRNLSAAKSRIDRSRYVE